MGTKRPPQAGKAEDKGTREGHGSLPPCRSLNPKPLIKTDFMPHAEIKEFHLVSGGRIRATAVVTRWGLCFAKPLIWEMKLYAFNRLSKSPSN